MHLFKNYINSLEIETSFKKEILDEALIKKHRFYVNLVYYLSPAYPDVLNKQLDILSFASYLYFKFLICFDNLIDTKNNNETEHDVSHYKRLFISLGFYEKSIIELSSLYKADDCFWLNLEKLKKQYFETVVLEKQNSKNKTLFSENLFIKIATGKSAISNVLTHALGSLNGTDQNSKKITECIEAIHIAFQYLDDIDDFQKDYKESQWTYAHCLVENYLTEKRINFEELTIKQLQSCLYTSGIAEYMMTKAHKNLLIAFDIASVLELKALSEYLTIQIKMCNTLLEDVNKLVLKTKIKASKSLKIESDINKKNTFTTCLSESIGSSIAYLENSLDKDNYWNDFLTSAGQGREWVTAYVGLNIAEIDTKTTLIDKIKVSLLNNKRVHNSFNELIIQDGDSTSLLVGFSKITENIKDDLFYNWLSFMNDDGGWVTYRNENELRNKLGLNEKISVNAWLSPKLCVTAMAAYILSLYDIELIEYKKTCEYLLKLKSNDGSWGAYWWTSSVYSTAFSIMALSKDNVYKDSCKDSLLWLIQQQNIEGYWANEKLNQSSAFYTAIALKALMIYDFGKYKSNILKGINWLLNNQTSDGSWLTNRILQIPATDIENPLEVKKWRYSSFGVDILVDDHNRTFTTSTVVNAMHLFSTLNSKSVLNDN